MSNSPESLSNVGICAVQYEKGSLLVDIESIEGAKEKFKAVKLPLNKQLLGCESFLREERPLLDFISASAKQTLVQFGQSSDVIDMVIIASAKMEKFISNSELATQLLENLKIEQAIPLAVTLQECTSMLAAIDIAKMYIQSQRYKNILVIAFDQIANEEERVKSFGVISDAVSSCIVTDAKNCPFEIISYDNQYDIKGTKGNDDFNSRKLLSQKATQKILSGAKVNISDIEGVFTTNFYNPVTQFNAGALQITKEQVYRQTASTLSHCVCSDPVINLAHYSAHNELKVGSLYLLQSYAPGFMASMLIQATSS